jgi:hypothetical protein
LALLAFSATLATARWWIYWTVLPLVLFGFVRCAPTPRHLGDDQRHLQAAGCELGLIRALRTMATPEGRPRGAS